MVGRRRGSGPTSLRFRLVVLTAALVTAFAVICLILTLSVRAVQKRAAEKQLVATARALSLAVDGRVLAGQALLSALATSDSLRQGDVKAFDARARKLASGPDTWFVMYEPDGRQVINTALPPGQLNLVPPSPTSHERLTEALRRGSATTGLYYGRRSQQRLVALERVVQDGRGHRYVLAMPISPRVFEGVFAAQALPRGWNGSLVDAHHLIIARNDGTDRFIGRSVTAPAARAMSRQREGVVDSVSQMGRPTLLAFTQSPLTGWSLLVGLPQGEASLPLDRSLMLLIPLALGLLAAGAAAIVLTVRQVDLSLRSLTRLAALVGSGEHVEELRTGMSETDAVAVVLAEASARLRARDAELREAANSLERRVADRTAELEATHLQLAHAQKLEALGRLTGGVAHDFNNLLTGVLGNLELLQRRLGDSPNQRYVANAQQAADRGAKLTRQLLAFSRRQRLDSRPVDLSRQIEEIRPLLVSALGSRGQLTLTCETAPLVAVVDPVELELAVLNLVINARDAMPDGGEVAIELRTERVTEPAMADEAPEPGAYVVLCVHDGGTGMTPEVRQRVLEPFYTTKPLGEGSGLGLSQVVGLAKQSQGGLRIESEPHVGTSVCIYLPRSSEAPGEVTTTTPADGRAAGSGGRILVIDDDPSVREVVSAMLAEAGYQVTSAGSGEAGLALLARPDVDPQWLLVDFAMPGMNGTAVAARARELRPKLPILIMSGFMDQSEIRHAWAGRVLSKPFDLDGLQDALREAAAA